MIVLESILLVIGLIISLVDLFKSDSNKNVIAKRILSVSYIVLFVSSILFIMVKYHKSEESGLKLFNTLNSIENLITIQKDSVVTILNKTTELKKRMDSIVTKTEKAIVQREKIKKYLLNKIRY